MQRVSRRGARSLALKMPAALKRTWEAISPFSGFQEYRQREEAELDSEIDKAEKSKGEWSELRAQFTKADNKVKELEATHAQLKDQLLASKHKMDQQQRILQAIKETRGETEQQESSEFDTHMALLIRRAAVRALISEHVAPIKHDAKKVDEWKRTPTARALFTSLLRIEKALEKCDSEVVQSLIKNAESTRAGENATLPTSESESNALKGATPA
ncbi:MAG: hypothetical protein MHM6MM_001595 [Cercozoa sp. M6MM]